MEDCSNNIKRRAFVKGLTFTGLMTAFIHLDMLIPAKAWSEGIDDLNNKNDFKHLVSDPLSLKALDLIGTVAFGDAMVSLAKESDSSIQKLFSLAGVPGISPHNINKNLIHIYKTGLLSDVHSEHTLKFPIENIEFAIILNIIRATAFGHEVQHHTVHEFETTLKGIGLLMGLTSIANSIVKTNPALEMVETSDESISKDPEKTLGDSIVQLTLLAALTQIPLTSFGNASIGNEEFREVRGALTEVYNRLIRELYTGLLPESDDLSRQDIVNHIHKKLSESKNHQVKKRVGKLIQNKNLQSYNDFVNAMKKEVTSHTNDIMTLLMATACDDAQASAGDPGPMVGLYQTFGIDFIRAIPANLPYTIYVGIERALFAAQRAGIDKSLFTAERINYMKRFLKETWKNLILYFVTVAPKISSKIAGTENNYNSNNDNSNDVGMTFTTVEQVLRDVESIISTVMDSLLGSFNGNALDIKKTHDAVSILQVAQEKCKIDVGRIIEKNIFPKKQYETTITREEVIAVQHKITGKKADGKTQYEKGKIQDLKDLQIELARLASTANTNAINEFASTLKDLRENMGTKLWQEIYTELQAQGEKPVILSVAKVLKENPKIKDLIDINYWHKRIGPGLTDTMFVVFLQGLHLPFLINTSERAIYNASWFRNMPLLSQEILSILFNNAIGMFADNWADCVAHSKWLTTMYFNYLEAQLITGLRNIEELSHDSQYLTNAIVKRLHDKNYFEDDSTALIPDRFFVRARQSIEFIEYLQSDYPVYQEELRNLLEEYLNDLDIFFNKAMNIAYLTAVTGGGKSKLGDATHFTFSAGEKDFTLVETLADFKRHPLYHVWAVVFSGAYSMYVGPVITKYIVGPGVNALGIGSGLEKKIKNMMQKNFNNMYPGFEKKLRELEKKEGKSEHDIISSEQQKKFIEKSTEINRRDMLSFFFKNIK